jgi:nitroreductase
MIETILTRRSVRSFLPDPVPPDSIDLLLKAGFHAPSAMNQRPWHFVVLEGERLEGLLRGLANTPKGAPLALVVCVDENRERLTRAGDSDAAAASQNILLAAHSLGLGAVWSAVLPESVSFVRGYLGLPGKIRPFSVIPVGKPVQRPAPMDRYDKSRVHRNGW